MRLARYPSVAFGALVVPALAACSSRHAAERPDPAMTAVTVVSLQGASVRRVRALMAQRLLPTFARVAEAGTGLAATVPVDAPATATARATFETGASPNAHGIVANSFHVRGDPIDTSRSGFTTRYESETLYDAAVRQRRSVATIGIAHRPGLSTANRAAWATVGRLLRPARVVTLTRSAPADTTRVVVQGDTAILVLRLSTSGISASVGREGRDEPMPPLDADDWVPVWLVAGSPRAGAWLKTLALSRNSDSARVYVGNIVVTDAEPASLTSHLESRVGPAPATPDWGNHAARLIDDATWREQVLREARYLTAAAEYVQRTIRPDLLIVAFNLLDAHEHQFLRDHPRHPTYRRATPAEQATWRAWIEDAYALADSIVGRVLPGSANVVVASEYALLPIHSRFQLAAALRQLGYVVSGRAASVRVIASSASAHVRINARGRESTGVVPDSNEAIAILASRLRDVRDPTTNDEIFARIETSGMMRERGERAAAYGDLRVIARPGYVLGDHPDVATVIDTPFLPGEHAFDPALPETHGIFMASGRNLDRAPLERVNAADVAVTAASLLGIDPPRGAAGTAVVRPVRPQR